MTYDLIGKVGWVLEKRFKACVDEKRGFVFRFICR